MADRIWEDFVRAVSEHPENKNCPLYHFLLHHRPVDYLEKVLAVARAGSCDSIKKLAYQLVLPHFRDIVESNYLNMSRRTLEDLRYTGISFLTTNIAGTWEYGCGLNITKTLLPLSIHHRDKWPEFLQLVNDAFTSMEYGLLDAVLDVFCLLPEELQSALVESEPEFTSGPAYLKGMLELLQRWEDARPFEVLPSVCDKVDHSVRSMLMEAAFSSPVFERTTDPYDRYIIVSTLIFCIRNTSFDFSPTMRRRIKTIISQLIQSDDNREDQMAAELCVALLESCFINSR